MDKNKNAGEYPLKLKLCYEAEITAEDINAVMFMAERGINYWCGGIAVIGKMLGRYKYTQIAEGGELNIFDMISE